MYFLIGIVFFLIGLLMTSSPQIFYDLTESWKSYTPGEPTSLFCISTRIGGAALIIVGIASIVLKFINFSD